MQKYILVTGGTGLVGYGLVKALLEQGFHPVLLVRSRGKLDKFKIFEDRISVLVTDFYDKKKLRDTAIQIAKQYPLFATVYALGATEAPDAKAYNYINAELMQEFIHIFKQEKVNLGRFIFVSSLSFHGARSKQAGVLTIDSPLNPMSDYARSKVLAEKLLSESYNDFLVVRPAAVFGEFDRQMAIVYRIVRNGMYVYFGSRHNTVGLVHSEDLGKHIVASITSQLPAGSAYISCTHNVSVETYLLSIARTYHQKRKINIVIPKFIMFVLAFCNEWMYKLLLRKATPVFNIQKVRELTGENWTCDTSSFYSMVNRPDGLDALDERVEQTAKWYADHQWMK